MTADGTHANEAGFWDLAEGLLGEAEVDRSTMMGLPCLRVRGAFFASLDRRHGDLLVKLPEPRVDQLVADGQAHAFAPAGRRFRQWAAIPLARHRSWGGLMTEALVFVSSTTAPGPG